MLTRSLILTLSLTLLTSPRPAAAVDAVEIFVQDVLAVAAQDDGTVYVSVNSDLIYKLDAAGGPPSIHVNLGALGYTEATALTLDSQGNLYAAIEYSNDPSLFYDGFQVLKLSPAGTLMHVIDGANGPCTFLRPVAVAIGANDGVFVLGRTTGTICSYDANGGSPLLVPMAGFRELATDASGRVYASLQSTVKRYTPGVGVTTMITQNGAGPGQRLTTARGVAVDSAGNLFVAGFDSDNLFRVAPDLSVTQILDASAGGTGILDRPVQVAVDGNDQVWVATTGSDSVFRTNQDGSLTLRMLGPEGAGGAVFFDPVSLDADAAGFAYVAGGSSNNVFELFAGSNTLDPFLVYKGRHDSESPTWVNVELATTDVFGTQTVKVQKPKTIGAPVALDGTPAVDATTHLLGYPISKAAAEQKHAALDGVKVVNEFGTMLVDTIKESHLLVPTGLDFSSPIGALDPNSHTVEFLKCYDVRAQAGYKLGANLQRDVEDDMNPYAVGARRMDVKTLKHLCVPFSESWTPAVKNPENALACFKSKLAAKSFPQGPGGTGAVGTGVAFDPKQLRHIPMNNLHTNDGLGNARIMDSLTEDEVCVPSLLDLP